MSREIAIGVYVPSDYAYGRSILRGVQTYCHRHPRFRMRRIPAVKTAAFANLQPGAFACVVTSQSEPAMWKRLEKLGTALVVASNGGSVSGYPHVKSDDLAVGKMGAEHFLSKGYRVLAFLGPEERTFATERQRGFFDRADQPGVERHHFPTTPDTDWRELAQAVRQLPGPVGLMAASDMEARYFINHLESPRQTVPNKIAVLGVDDDELESALSVIPLSSIRLSGEAIGFRAAERGVQAAHGRLEMPHSLAIPPREIVHRHSTDAIAVEDPLVRKVLLWMRERLRTIESAAQIVQQSGVSRRTLENRFAVATGSSLGEELTRQRVTRARELIAEGRLSMKEIAYLVGFSEQRRLTLAFKRVTGELPTEFRRRIHPNLDKVH